jgi:hypothetical protein
LLPYSSFNVLLLYMLRAEYFNSLVMVMNRVTLEV